MADDQQQLCVIDGPGQVPVRLNVIRNFVIVLRRVFVALLLAERGVLADVVDDLIGIECGHTLLGELEMI